VITRIARRCRRTWEKNWPEVHCALRRGLPTFVLARRVSDHLDGIPVFCYHDVEADVLEADLAFLARNEYVTLTADRLCDHLEGVSEAPRRSVVLTVDDGMANLYEVIGPLLKRYAMHAVAFVASCFHTDTADPGPSRPCTWDELRELVASGHVEIQSHTHTHRYVPRWPQPAALSDFDPAMVETRRGPAQNLEEDLRQSKSTLEAQLGTTIRHLAFPCYNGTDEAIAIGRACGFRGFWWGVLPHRPDNRPGDSLTHIVRISAEFVRRLPGDGRAPLRSILQARYGSAAKWWTR
jgi:peptidoglycan/xylan/chitin deacetylase (PgdA/CDA1 family)